MRAAAAIVCLALAGCPKPPSPPAPRVARIAELVVIMSRQGDEHPGHGTYHRAKNHLERELWSLVKDLPVVEKGDELLLLAVENVYTRYDANFLQGYLWHWPYLCSRRAIPLCDRVLRDYPDSAHRDRALWLKAFALRCPPTERDPDAEADLEVYYDQRAWEPDLEAARAIYREIADRHPQSRYARAARQLASRDGLAVVLPRGPLEPDPRSAE